MDGPSQAPGLEWTPTSRASGFLSNRGVVPVHDPCELLRAGDVESNPGPSCSSCNVTLRSGAPSLECSEAGCTARCHEKKECSGMSRYGSQPEWRCRSHGGTVVEPPTAIPARPSGTCISCMGIVRPHRPWLTCSEPECQVKCHKKCSKRSRYATGDWSCPQHDTAPLHPYLTIAGREVSSLSSSQPDPDTGEKRTCKGCKKTIARNTTGIACTDCKGLFHKVCVGRRGSTRDQVEMYAGGLSWTCGCVPTNSQPGNEQDAEERGSRARFVPKGTLRLLQWNADGIKLKISELGERMKNLDMDIALIQESKLREKDKTPRIEGYSTVRADRRGPKPGGGLISFLKKDIAFEYRPCWNQMTGNVESSRLKIRLSKKSWITLHNLYIPPNRVTNTKEVLVLDNLPADKNSFFGGDLNGHSQLWDQSQLQDSRGVDGRRVGKTKPGKHRNAGISATVRALVKKRNFFRRRINAHRQEWVTACGEVTEAVSAEKEKRWTEFVDTLESSKDYKKTWGILGSISGKPDSCCPNEAIRHNGKVLVSNESKADAFAAHYAKVSKLEFSREEREKTRLAKIRGNAPVWTTAPQQNSALRS